MSSLGRSSALLASGTLVSRVLGFAKAIVLAQAIGVVGSGSADAFSVSTIVPASIYAIIGGGLLSAVLVPQIVRASRGPDGGGAYVNKLVTLALIGFAAIGALATLSAPLLVDLFTSVDVPAANVRLATAFAYWSLPQIFFLGLYALLGEVLNARKSFGPFTWAPVLNNVIGIASIGVFMAVYGADPDRAPGDWSPAMIALLAGGASLGIATQAIVLFAFWRRVGLSYRPDFGWRGVGLGSAARAAGWTLGMLVAGQVAGVIETNVSLIATGRGASAATMATSWLIFMLPHSIITVSIVTALYTTMSEHASRGDLTALRGDLSTALRAVALALTLAAAVLIVCAGPFARVFTGDFGDVQQMAAVIVAYLVGLVPFSLLFVVQRVFYSLGDTRTPFVFTIVQVVLVIGGVLACSLLPVDRIAMGIASVVSAAGAVQLVIASILLRRKVAADPAPIARSLLLDLAAAVPAGVAGYLVGLMLGAFRADGFAMSGGAAAILTMAVLGAVMSVVYLGALRLLRSPDLAAITAILGRRFGRRA
ncbi:murein biosynthesis integral membrane protein MurJ [Naasia lichenicola]|uniref:Murein biosynthesis integral membrane protein MurJ n=1 Tax=Naasia lichenicola TaxID=2565933 RepID=A0A4S4FI11_9MICO|nr:murein biosynthesis integral membrane protein MurJ [Naasia lichenicola]THG29474.1 murein biosynthesis integral membrane protein MurJ [Naasia lichenicola]